MDTADIVFGYFPQLDPKQQANFIKLGELYRQWNSQINLVSRKDIDNLYTNHILHSLGVAKIGNFKPGTTVLDVGTGGGLPGIPLAMMFPEVNFHLVDSTKKKIVVVQDLIEKLRLDRVTTEWTRAEQLTGTYDFVIGRAVTTMPQFLKWCSKRVAPDSKNELSNGILYLKGGDIMADLDQMRYPYQVFSLSDYFQESYYLEKKIIHLSI